jgi:2-keto-4-pentenoate hydratase
MVDAAQELARQMLADYDARTPGQLFGEPLDLTTVQAYALQAEIARLRQQRGERVIGYKVGCTSPAVQQ